MKIFSGKISSSPCFYFLSIWLLLQPIPRCIAQNAQDLMRKDSPVCSIVLSEAPDGSSSEYFFYDNAGKLVKTMRHDQFESRHPIFKLNLPKSPSENSDARFFKDLATTFDSNSNLESKKRFDKKLSELRSLKKYGLNVKTPEKATTIIGHPTLDQRPIVSRPASKFLIKIETARVLDAYAMETQGVSNALLDCSYISVYNFTGSLIKEIMIPNKTVSFASISDDGHFMACTCEYSLVWDEGLSSKPEGVLIVDLRTNEMNYIVTPETENSIDPTSILFADNYFQMTIGNPWSGDSCVRMYINPYDRKYYMKSYGEDRQKSRKPLSSSQSFIQFEGVIEFPEQFKGFSY